MNGLFAVVLQVPSWQPLGLAFLLGSFTVATLSDLRRLSAQREFVEVWWLFALVVLGLEIHDARSGDGMHVLALKWGLIVALSLASWVKWGRRGPGRRRELVAVGGRAGVLRHRQGRLLVAGAAPPSRPGGLSVHARGQLRHGGRPRPGSLSGENRRRDDAVTPAHPLGFTF